MRFLPGLVLVGLAGVAAANGRPAATSTINFEQGAPQHVVAGMTFGLVRSDDGGATWKWMCEKAVGYGGTYDPDYAFTGTGAIFATTFDGLNVNRDNCSFDTAPSGTTFVSQVEVGPTGDVFYAAADPADARIYRSTNDGASFTISASPGQNNDWWDSLKVAPSDPLRVYLTGYRFTKVCNAASSNVGATCAMDAQCLGTGAMCIAQKQFLLFESIDGGSNYTAMSQTGITTSNNSAIDVVGISATNPDEIYAHANLENGEQGDGLYKSSNAGATWTKILTIVDPFGVSVLLRSDGSLVVGTQSSGALKSANGASCTSQATCNWVALSAPPHINCLVENPANHDVWACTQNITDGYGIMKSTDLQTWSGVLRFQAIAGVVACAADTVQAQQCVGSYQSRPSVWCCLEQQLGITDTSVDCTGAAACAVIAADGAIVDPPSDAAALDAGRGGAGALPGDSRKAGCCHVGEGGEGALLLACGVGLLLVRRKRRA